MSSRRRRRTIENEPDDDQEEEPEQVVSQVTKQEEGEQEDEVEDLDDVKSSREYIEEENNDADEGPEEDQTHSQEVGVFRSGSIRRIKLENFLTYDAVEFEPGPRMNMVVGANGTGKSSILNAICLGLGGEPKHLGRADDARAFIQNGKEEALVEIEVEPIDDETPYIFRREIDRNKGTERGRGRGASTYYMNGQKVRLEEVHDVVKNKYNIDLSNLCTFLPQDKVGSFSGLTQQELLIETEKTLSASQHLYTTHLQLIEAEKELQTQAGQAGAVQIMEGRMEEIEREIQSLERAKVKLEEREEALQQQHKYEAKRAWTEVDDMLEKATALKEKRNVAKQKLKEASASLQPLKEKEADLKEQQKAVNDEIQKCQKKQDAAKDAMGKHEQKFTTHDDNIERTLADACNIDNDRDELKQKLRHETDKFNKYADILKQMDKTPDETKKKLDEAQAKSKAASQAYRRVTKDLHDKNQELQDHEEQAQRIQRKLAKQTDAKQQQREQIYSRFQETRQICQLIERHKNDFRKPVRGPVAAYITPKPNARNQHISFLEQHVNNSIWKGFIVETKEDQDRLYRLIRQDHKIPINIFVADRIDERITRPYSDQRFQLIKEKYSVEGYLDQFFEAPEVVMQVLRVQSRLHHVLLGGEQTFEGVDKGLLEFVSQREQPVNGRTLQSSVVCCHNQNVLFKYQTVISEYTGKASTRQDNPRNAEFLKTINSESDQVTQNLKENLERIHEEIGAMRPVIAQLEKEKDAMQGEAQELSQGVQVLKDDFQSLQVLVTKHTASERKLQEIQHALDDYEVEAQEKKKQLSAQLQQGMKACINVLMSHSKANETFIRCRQEKVRLQLKGASITAAFQRAYNELDEAAKSFDVLQDEGTKLNDEFKQARQDLERLRTQAGKDYPLEDEDRNPLPLKAEIEKMEFDSVEDIEAAIEDCEQRVKAIQANPQVIQQYEAKIQERDELQIKLNDAKNFRASKMADIEQKRAPWLASLENSIAKIDSKFSQYMAEMGNTGGVSLDTAKPDAEGNLGNFKDWGIRISVSFRENAKAQVLSARVHSGGERSVSTIMYLMALQDMMVAPFRCVDEINQGLDESNERGVFKRIVENSCKPPRGGPRDHTGQYFLITPKLLPNLYDMEEEAMTILFVFNGQHNFSTPDEWQMKHIVAAGNRAGEDNDGDRPPSKKRRSMEETE